jgi:hypothetical protein
MGTKGKENDLVVPVPYVLAGATEQRRRHREAHRSNDKGWKIPWWILIGCCLLIASWAKQGNVTMKKGANKRHELSPRKYCKFNQEGIFGTISLFASFTLLFIVVLWCLLEVKI